VKVVKAKPNPLDLSKSVLATGEYREHFLAQPEASQPFVQVTGCALFDSDERLLPLVSDYLCRNFRNNLLADPTVTSYASRISCLLADLKTKVEFESSDRDEALLSVTRARLEAYLASLEAAGLAPKTIRSRDAAYLHFFSRHLCQSFDGTPALREDNPYKDGMLRKGNAHPRGIIQPCSIHEIEQLILHTQSERERCILQTMYDAGLRESEVPRLTLQAIRNALDFQKLRFVSSTDERPVKADYCPLEIMGSKGRRNELKPRVALVSRATLERIEDYHRTPLYRRFAQRFATPEETPAFFNAHGGPYKTKSVEKLLDRVSKRAVKARKIRRNVSSHKLRHGAAYTILSSPDLGQDFLDRLVICSKSHGHSHTHTTETYTLIPHDIYRKLCIPDALDKTKTAEMQALKERTFKRIRLGDKK
jgi:site-specific recombinase XerD